MFLFTSPALFLTSRQDKYRIKKKKKRLSRNGITSGYEVPPQLEMWLGGNCLPKPPDWEKWLYWL
jgi:hypothetical protein